MPTSQPQPSQLFVNKRLSVFFVPSLHYTLRSVPYTRGRKTSEAIFQQFLDLVGNSKVKHLPVEHFARELCVTPKYLSTVCKNHSGKTANEWIREYVLEDIRYYLMQTNLSIKQICALLGFPNSSFFGRYVKEHFGVPPSQLRKG